MGQIKLSTASGGSVTLDATNSASNFVITVPASTATMAVNGPCFSAYQSVAQSIPTSTATKLQFQTKEFDTATCFDATTNYRFTPTVAGYYQITSGAFFNGALATLSTIIAIYKNLSAAKAVNTGSGNANGWYNPTITALVYMNGSTDFIEVYLSQYSGAAQVLSANSTNTYFQAAMVRSA